MELTAEPDISALFPDRRLARVRIVLENGATVSSKEIEAFGEPEEPVSEQSVRQKFFAYACPVLGLERSERISRLVRNCEMRSLLDEIAS